MRRFVAPRKTRRATESVRSHAETLLSLASSLSLCRLCLTAVLSLAVVQVAAQDAKPLGVAFDLDRLSQPPKTFPAENILAEGVKAVFFEGLPYQGRPRLRNRFLNFEFKLSPRGNRSCDQLRVSWSDEAAASSALRRPVDI